MASLSKGYTAQRLGVTARATELNALLSNYRKGPQRRVGNAIAEVKSALQEIKSVLGKPVKDLDILEIGSGQLSIQLAVLGVGNRAVGIDQETAGTALDATSIAQMIRKDGLTRAAKTTFRKMFGFDDALKNEYKRQTQIAWPPLKILHVDATKTSFEDASFDVIYSRAVFEHISSPAAVLKEVCRITRPGGVFYCLLHLYTSDSGCHDVRIFADQRKDLPFWSHLRDQHRHKVIENTYLNRLRLDEWRTIFERGLPGVRFEAMMDDAGEARRLELAQCRRNGELADFSDEELLSSTVKAVWRRS